MHDRLLTLLRKYNVAGPRYTSYPTVPAWVEGLKPEDYRASLGNLKAGETLSLYFHLPFCEKLCHFCGCMQVITSDHSRSRPYVNRVLAELDRVAAALPADVGEVRQIHFGGGTPNFLQPPELSEIAAAIRNRFAVSPAAEWAIEMHPRTSTPAFCENLAKLGFNRISLGVQDFDPKVQALINRFQTYEMTAEMVTLLRGLGFDSFNFDLIYGLPGQGMDEWRRTLAQVLELKPNRLAVYSYAHVPWKSPVQRSFKDSDLPPPELKLELFKLAYETFLASGYRSIGMDHFALADDELCRAAEDGSLHRNFMGYSTKADAHQIGFGVSAISFVGGNYFQNLKELPAYEAAIDGGELASFRGFRLNRDDLIRRDLVTRIMCLGRVDTADFGQKWELRFQDYFAEDLKSLEGLVADGLVEISSQALTVKGEGFLFLRNIAMSFDRYLPAIQGQAKNPTFSKTV
ncbi:MAG TPA: oxygen-independent coproporphyrinogen III oxidase [bacterium]|nr:oxygen-independent coproporphyrinogen III oxidase [bacterium]